MTIRREPTNRLLYKKSSDYSRGEIITNHPLQLLSCVTFIKPITNRTQLLNHDQIIREEIISKQQKEEVRRVNSVALKRRKPVMMTSFRK